jgi:hypothetical protein
MRAKLLKLNAEPKCVKSNTDKLDPNRPIPYSDKDEPNRKKLFAESVELITVQSEMINGA